MTHRDRRRGLGAGGGAPPKARSSDAGDLHGSLISRSRPTPRAAEDKGNTATLLTLWKIAAPVAMILHSRDPSVPRRAGFGRGVGSAKWIRRSAIFENIIRVSSPGPGETEKEVRTVDHVGQRPHIRWPAHRRAFCGVMSISRPSWTSRECTTRRFAPHAEFLQHVQTRHAKAAAPRWRRSLIFSNRLPRDAAAMAAGARRRMAVP